MEDKASKYALRGVSASKSEVHEAIEGLDRGLHPLAFCKILPDYVGGDPAYCNVMHADTAGTKTALAYLHWREFDYLSVWSNISQDAIVMNVDDMACVGCVEDIVLSSTIGRNKHLITAAVLKSLIQGNSQFADKMADLGISLHLAGGETADVGDIVRTIDTGITAFCRMSKSKLVINDIQAGDVIVGFASFGQATYESKYNSGIGSNGLTSARHDVLSKYYAEKYPECVDPNTDSSVTFVGSKKFSDVYENHLIGDLLLSPTRTYLPLIRDILTEHRSDVHGIIHNTGGGQTKVLKFVKNKRIVKDNLFKTPPIFRLIQSESGTTWEEMYQVFNMGHRLEIYTTQVAAQKIIDVASKYHIDAQIIGRVEESEGQNLKISSEYGEIDFEG